MIKDASTEVYQQHRFAELLKKAQAEGRRRDEEARRAAQSNIIHFPADPVDDEVPVLEISQAESNMKDNTMNNEDNMTAVEAAVVAASGHKLSDAELKAIDEAEAAAEAVPGHTLELVTGLTEEQFNTRLDEEIEKQIVAQCPADKVEAAAEAVTPEAAEKQPEVVVEKQKDEKKDKFSFRKFFSDRRKGFADKRRQLGKSISGYAEWVKYVVTRDTAKKMAYKQIADATTKAKPEVVDHAAVVVEIQSHFENASKAMEAGMSILKRGFQPKVVAS